MEMEPWHACIAKKDRSVKEKGINVWHNSLVILLFLADKY